MEMNKKKKIIFSAVGAVIVMLVLYITMYLSDASGFNKFNGLIVTGNSECKEIDLNSKIAGKIDKIYVEEGQQIKADDLIVEIDSEQLLAKKEQIEAKVAKAENAIQLQQEIADSNVTTAQGAYDAAKSQLAKAQGGARDQEVAQAKANYEVMKKSYDRIVALYNEGGISAQKKDEIEAKYNVAKSTYEMAIEGAREEDINSAQGLVTKAEGALTAANASKMQVQIAESQYLEALAALKEIETLINDTKITAPFDGTIMEINSDEAELISTGMPLVTIADLNDIKINVQIMESDLQEVKLKNSVDIRFAAIKDVVFKGTITSIKAKPEFAKKRATNNFSDDIVAYDVTIRVEANDEAIIFPGMTAYVQFIKQ